jgi:2-oxoglutarate dehydrogenase E2 component (dihydrolipoamide succinyltransferase)
MALEIKIPSPGESITEVEIGEWKVAVGDYVKVDDPIVEIETDKANLEVPAPKAGTIVQLMLETGDTAEVGDVIAQIEPGEAPAQAAETPTPKATSEKTESETRVMPAAARALAQAGLSAADVQATGPGGRLLKEDVIRHQAKPATPAGAPVSEQKSTATGPRSVERVRMTRLRRTIAERLVTAQNDAAMLTTFNEVDMSAAKAIRARYKDSFIKAHDIKLGFMSFFIKAAVEALKAFPRINAYIDGDEIVFHNYYDIGVAVGGGKGLVVPVIRNAESLGFAEVEQTITDFGRRARDNKLGLDELQGGTFTISNGGVYGSLMSTPILNPPQSGILGMHTIQDRPVVVDGQIVIRPMMYIALTYDHRIVDGKEAVSFLKRIKECVEDPTRILLEV